MNSRLTIVIALASACSGWSQGSAAPAQPRGEVVYNQNTSTIGGEPFLVKGIYGVGAEVLRQVAGYGFNVVRISSPVSSATPFYRPRSAGEIAA